MRKSLIAVMVIIIIIVVGFAARIYFKKPASQVSVPPPAKESAEEPTGKIPFDTNDNLDQALQELDQM